MFENLFKHLGSLNWNYHYLRRCWWHFLSFNRNGRKWYIQEFLSASPLPPCHYRHFTIYKSIWDAAKLLETTTLIFLSHQPAIKRPLKSQNEWSGVCVWSAGKLHYKSWNNCDNFLVVMLDTWIFLILNIIIKVSFLLA